MSEESFKAGDKVNLKNNHRVIYIYLKDDGDDSWCLDPNNQKIKIPRVALMRYEAPSIL